MFSKFRVFCFIGLLLVACNDKQRFSDFSDERLVDILFDISLSNSIVENAPSDMRDSMRNAYLNQIAIIQNLERTMIDSIIDYVHLDHKRFIGISDSLDTKLKRILEENK